MPQDTDLLLVFIENDTGLLLGDILDDTVFLLGDIVDDTGSLTLGNKIQDCCLLSLRLILVCCVVTFLMI